MAASPFRDIINERFQRDADSAGICHRKTASKHIQAPELSFQDPSKKDNNPDLGNRVGLLDPVA